MTYKISTEHEELRTQSMKNLLAKTCPSGLGNVGNVLSPNTGAVASNPSGL